MLGHTSIPLPSGVVSIDDGEESAFFNARAAKESLHCDDEDEAKRRAIEYFLGLGIRKNIATTSDKARRDAGIPAKAEYTTRNAALAAARASVKR